MSNYENSKEIRQDIDETRRHMGRKLDAIQNQLSSDNLKAKARDVVNEVATSTADSLSDYMRNNMGDVGHSLATSLKRNPIPTALVGLGLGWLLVEALSYDTPAPARYPVQRYRPAATYGAAAEYEPWRANPNYRPAYAGAVPQSNQPGVINQVKSTLSQAADTAQNKAEQWLDQTKENMSEAAAKAQQLRDEARLQGHWATMDAQDRAEEWQQEGRNLTHQASYNAQQAMNYAQQTVNQGVNYANEAAHSASDYAHYASDQVGAYSRYASDQARYYSRQAGRQAYAAGEQVIETIEENPLTFGAVALAVGAAVGLLLPQTRYENEWVGHYSDQVTDAARTTANDVMTHAQEAIEEIRPELERSTQTVINDLKETGRMVVEDLKHSGEVVQEEAKAIGNRVATVAEQKGEAMKNDIKENNELNAKTPTAIS